jgi:heptosyltransferase-3
MNPSSLLPDLPSGAQIVLIRLRSIGDVILLTPAIHMLKEWRPDLEISVVVESRFRELLEGNPDIQELLDPGSGSGVAKIAARLRAIRTIRERKFSMCVNLHGGPTGTLLTRASGAKMKVGFEYYRSRGVYDVLVPDTRKILGKNEVHTTEHQTAIFFHLGMPRREIPRARIFVKDEHRDWWRQKSQEVRFSATGRYAVIQPTALYATKQWAAEHFARLGKFLKDEAGLLPIYSCGPGESHVLDAVERASKNSILRLESVSLGQFAAAIEGARIFVGNDSGPAHMAAALGRPGVVIFGSSSSVIWGPWPRDPARARIVQNSFACNPCPGDRCYQFERPECILSVTFEQVRAAVKGVLRATQESETGDRRE